MARVAVSRALLLALLAPLGACSCDGSGALGVVGAQLIVTPSHIQLAPIARGASAAHPLQLVNVSPAVVTVSRVGVAGSADVRVEGATFPLVLAAGAEATLSVVFTPTTQGAHHATLSLWADDREEAHAVEVDASASEASMCVSPAFVPFNRADGRGEQLVTITACGEAPITVERLTFEASDDTLTYATAPPPFTLRPGERRVVRVAHAPTDATRAAGAVLTVHGSGTPSSAAVVITATPEIVPSSAGRYLYYWQVTDEGGSERSNIMRLALQAGGEPEVFWGSSAGNGCPGCHHVSPDGRYLAVVVRGAGLSVVDTNTRQELVLPGNATRANGMSWRPEVSTRHPYQLVYSADGRLYKASVLDGDLGELPNTSTTATGAASLAHVMPAWSSDGRIAYVSGVRTARRSWALEGGADLMIIDQDGGTPARLTGTSSRAVYYPAFSPDGRWLAVTESRLGTTYSSTDARVTLIRTDGSGLRRELPAVNAVGASRAYPAWSLDGNYLGFSASASNAGRGDWDVYFVSVDPQSGLETGSPGAVPRANGEHFEHGLEWAR